MSVKFQIRGTQLDAYFASAWATALQANPSNSLATVDTDNTAGVFGGKKISVNDLGQGTRVLAYTGADNFSLNGAFSVLMRIVPKWSGAPSQSQLIAEAGGGRWGLQGLVSIGVNSTGKLKLIMAREDDTTLYNGDIGSALSLTSGTPTDLWVTWDGTTTANAIKVYQDGTLVGQATATGAVTTRKKQACASIILGTSSFWSDSNLSHNELVIWDDVQNPATYGTRSDFIATSAAEGYHWSDPGAANVMLNTSYYAGTAGLQTGLLDEPDPSNVKAGVTYYEGQRTGTYTGSDLWSAPPPDTVLSPASGGPSSYLNNGVEEVGTYVAPAVGDVRSGTAFGPAGSLIGALLAGLQLSSRLAKNTELKKGIKNQKELRRRLGQR